jgi:hypothetical protein
MSPTESPALLAPSALPAAELEAARSYAEQEKTEATRRRTAAIGSCS